VGSLSVTWPSYSADGNINGNTISAAATLDSVAYASTSGIDWEFGLSIAYGGTAAGVTVYILRDVDGTNYEDAASAYSFQMVGTASATVRRGFTVRGEDAGRFKVRVSNPSGNSTVTATLNARQATGTY
jgi:hypothetical protein